MASSASCQRSLSPTSAAETWNSDRTRRSRPLTTWRLAFSEPLSGRWRTTLARPTATVEGFKSRFLTIFACTHMMAGELDDTGWGGRRLAGGRGQMGRVNSGEDKDF